MLAAPAHGAGFAVAEQGARVMGLAGASAAQTQDASAIFHNPAGVAFLKGRQLYLGAALDYTGTDFTGASPFPGPDVTESGDAGLGVPPAFDYSHQLSERMVVGVGVHVPYRLRASWKNRDTSYSGRFVSKTAELTSYSLSPTVAYKLADRLALGAALDVRLSDVAFEKNLAVPVNPFSQRVQDGASMRLSSGLEPGFGFAVGLVAKPIEQLAVGVSYRHKVSTDFSGSAGFTPIPTGNAQLDTLVARGLPAEPVPVTTEVVLPSLLALGAEYRHGDWLLAADVHFQQWSSFAGLQITLEDRPELSSGALGGYRDSLAFRVGVERRLNEAWDVRGGYFYDRSAALPEAVGPAFPDASRHGAAVGASFRRGRLRVDAANWLVFSGERSTEGKNRDGYDGSYKSFAEVFSISVGLSF